MPSSNDVYRPCVGIVLFNKDGHVFVGERIDTPGAWQMPQGGIDEGEDIETAAFRELQEETGIHMQSVKFLRTAEDTLKYDLPPHLQQKLWGGRFAGQEQTWVAMQFQGQDNEIDINAFSPPEFNAWEWVPLGQTLDKIVPFKRDTYKQVISFFADIPEQL